MNTRPLQWLFCLSFMTCTNPASANEHELGYLDIDGNHSVLLHMICFEADVLNIFPYVECRGAVDTNLPGDQELLVDDVRVMPGQFLSLHEPSGCIPTVIGDKVFKERCDRENKNAAYSSVYELTSDHGNRALFDWLYQNEFIEVNGEVAYYDVKELVDRIEGDMKETFTWVQREQREIILISLALLLCAAVLIALIIWLKKRLPEASKRSQAIVKENLPVIKNQIADTKQRMHDRRSQRIVSDAVLDEAARIQARRSMDLFDEKDILAIQKNINEMLEKGDYETAQTLISTLRKIKGE